MEGVTRQHCRRTYCVGCGEEMIHRDNRHSYEASSAFNQIIHREGPRRVIVGDIDTYAYKDELKPGPNEIIRLIEHKQPDQKLKSLQGKALACIDRCLRHASYDKLIAVGSGVFVVRGDLEGSNYGRRKVDFSGKQIVRTLNGELVLSPKTRKELWDWLCCGLPWTARNEQW